MSDTLIIDCYDSFTYNLVHGIEAILDGDVDVKRVDQMSLRGLAKYTNLVFSPGAGLPTEWPELIPLMREAMRLKKRVLGVCLGMQAMAIAEGGYLKNLKTVHHGVAKPLILSADKSELFRDCDESLSVGRYHSWVVDEKSLDSKWLITSRDEAGDIMSMEHRSKPFYGIQFHPESVLTPVGKKILENFLFEKDC